MKKLFSLFMSLAMLLSLSAGVLAVETETLPVILDINCTESTPEMVLS